MPRVPPVRPSPVWTSSKMSRVPCFRQSSAAAAELLLRSKVHAFSLDDFEDQCRDVITLEPPFQRLDLAEAAPLGSREEGRRSSSRNSSAAVEGQRSEAEAVEGVIGVEIPGPLGRLDLENFIAASMASAPESRRNSAGSGRGSIAINASASRAGEGRRRAGPGPGGPCPGRRATPFSSWDAAPSA